jgi:CheY-like chemotaxis protein
MAGEPILIVDDNPLNLKLAKVILVSEGYDVKTAIDAEEALHMLESLTPALILMDLQLPRMDGLELTRQIKADPTRQGIVIIALTAAAMKGDDERVLAAGCDGYMSKPIDTDALGKMVARYLAESAARKSGRMTAIPVVENNRTVRHDR